MLKRFDVQVLHFDGKPWMKDKEGKEPLTVAEAIVEALGSAYEDERLGLEEKLKRTILAERIFRAGSTPTEISPENLVMIRALVAKRWPTFITGSVCRALDGDEPPAAT
jgi:hypothetical protein